MTQKTVIDNIDFGLYQQPSWHLLSRTPSGFIFCQSLDLNYYRLKPIVIESKSEIAAFDHDFPHLAKGKAIPYGIYDLTKNSAYICIGTSHDTSEFVCDSIKKWWIETGQRDYPNVTSILTLMDGGGSNSSRHYVFKEALQNLANEIGVEIRIAHYPPYTSKWNPIEHRLFPHITRAMQGVILKSHLMVKELLEKTKTTTGLKVIVSIADKIYVTGKGYAEGFKKNMKIKFDEYLGKWNYRAVPMQVEKA